MPPQRHNPSAPGAHVISTDASTCPPGDRCHIEGKGIVRFGTRFNAGMAKRVANNAAVLVNDDGRRIASGTVIDVGQGASRGVASGEPVSAAVVLCANHSLDSLSTSFSVLVTYRLHAPNAPGSSWELTEKKNAAAGDAATARRAAAAQWTPSMPVATDYATGQKTAVLERGSDEMDYALIFVEFSPLSVPPRPFRPLGRSLSDEVLLVGHPYQTTYDCEPTQASAGRKIVERSKFQQDDSTDFFAFASLSAWHGMSGGGVYNTSMDLVGVLKGSFSPVTPGVAFLNLGAVVDAKPKGTDLLQLFMGGGRYLVG